MIPARNPDASTLLPLPPLAPLVRLHTADVAGVAARFYAPPSGDAEMPWCSYADVQAIGAPDDDMKRFFVRRARPFVQFGRDGNERRTLVPHWLASDLLRSAIAVGKCERAARNEFHAEANQALRAAAALKPEGEQADYCTLARTRLRHQLGGD